MYITPQQPPPTCCIDRTHDSCCCGQCGRSRTICHRNCFAGLLVYMFLFISFAATITGIVFLGLTASDTRANSISTFNAASTVWPNTSLPFAALVSVAAGGNPGSESALVRSTAVDSFPDTADGVIVPTVGIHWGSTFEIFSPRGFSLDTTVTLTVTSNNGTDPPRVSQAGGLHLFAKKTTTSGSGSSQRTTTTYYCLTSICAAINDAGQITEGCASDENTGSAAIAGLSTSNCGSDVYRSFSVPVTVRSNRDPYVVAMQETGGTLQFGLSNPTKLVVGVSLLVCGVVIFSTLCICISRMPKPQPYIFAGAPGLPPTAFVMAGGPPALPPQQSYEMQKQQFAAQQQQPYYGAPMGAPQLAPQQYGVQQPQVQSYYPSAPPASNRYM